MIGLISSVSGPMAPGFRSEVAAAKPAVDLINQKGGITVDGQKYLIEIVTADDQSSPSGAVSAANKVLQAGVKFIIAPMFIPSNMAIAPVCEEAKALRIVSLSADPMPFGPPNRYCFNAQATLYNIPVAYDKFKTLYPNVKRIAIIKPDDPGAKVPGEILEKELKKRGYDIVFTEAYLQPTEDFYPTLGKALAQKPDAIEGLFAILPCAKGIINQSRELGFKGPIIALSGGFGDTNILNAMIDPKYAYDICHCLPDVNSPKMLPIVAEMGKLVEKETGEPFNFDHLVTLQALLVIVDGIQKAQSFDVEKVAKTLETDKAVRTPYGKGRFIGHELIGIDRLMISDVPFSRIMNGKVEYELLPEKR